MRVIDLLKEVIITDIFYMPENRYIRMMGITFEYINPVMYRRFVDLDGETKVLRFLYRTRLGFYYIEIGTNKTKGWLSFPLNSHLISVDLRDFSDIDQNESYLVLKYGKSILDELDISNEPS